MTALRDLAGAASDLLLGSSCVGCERAGPALCATCAAEFEQWPYAAHPTPCPAGLPTPYAVAPYAGAVKAAVVAHKERAALVLARPLGRALALSVLAAVASDAGSTSDGAPSCSGPVRLAWPPSNPATVRDRGHDPMQRIAQACQRSLRATGIPSVGTPVLERTRRLADQAGLSAGQRVENLDGAFAVRPRFRVGGARFIVVDDVLTTGATATECARALRQAGATVPAVAVIAATRRRMSDAGSAQALLD